MKAFTITLLSGLLFLAAVGPAARSQEPKASPEQRLLQMKEQNQKLLEQQAATLLKLDEVLKDAEQLRTLARRT